MTHFQFMTHFLSIFKDPLMTHLWLIYLIYDFIYDFICDSIYDH